MGTAEADTWKTTGKRFLFNKFFGNKQLFSDIYFVGD